MEGNSALCEWCNASFRPRRGGSPQRFCGSKCRTAFWSELRRWGERAIGAGILTIADIRNGDPAACTLLQGALSVAPVHDTRPRMAVPLPSRMDEYTRQEEFEQLMLQAIAARRRG
jgi:hypothetical protein